MNTPWLTQLTIFIVIIGVSLTHAMEPQQDSYAHAMVGLLPTLAGHHKNVTQQFGLDTFQLAAQQKEQLYTQALSGSNPLTQMVQVQKPVIFEREVIKNGKTSIQKSSYEYALSHLAQGYLLQQAGDNEGARAAFDRALCTAGSKVQEQPVALTASFELAYAAKFYAIAFDDLEKLHALIKVCPLFAPYKKIADLQLQKLIDVDYVPAVKCKADSQEDGSIDAQYKFVQLMAIAASNQKTRDTYYEKLHRASGYFDRLDIHPEFRPLVDCMRLAYQAAQAYRSQEFLECSQKLIEIVKLPCDGNAMAALQGMAQLQIGFAAKDEVYARCYQVKEQLASAHKATRAKGVEAAGKLVIDALSSDVCERFMQEFNILDELEKFCSGYPAIAGVCAQYYCQKILDLYKDQTAQEQLIMFAKRAQTNARLAQQEEGLARVSKHILNFSQGILLFAQGSYGDAADLLIDSCSVAKKAKPFEIALRTCAHQLLQDLAKRGVWKARCFLNTEFFKSDNQKITVEKKAACCCLALDILDNAPSEFLESNFWQQLFTQVQEIAKTKDPFANYLAARMIFRVSHYKSPDGLKPEDSLTIALPLTYAVASLSHSKEAQQFARALSIYQRVQVSMTKGEHDQAAQDCFQLLSLELPAHEQKMCSAFARAQLRACALKGCVSACTWDMGYALESEDQKEQRQAIDMAAQLFSRLMESDFEARRPEEWATVLKPFIEQGIAVKIEPVYAKNPESPLGAHAGATLCMCHVIQAMTCQRLLSDQQPLESVVQMQTALERAQTMFSELSKNSIIPQNEAIQLFYPIIGRCYYILSHMSLDYGETEQAFALMETGAKLGHPACMRTHALWILEDDQIKNKELFDYAVSLLHQAYSMGDKVAGAVLAVHYFEGPSKPFACGLFLPRDSAKGLKFAQETCSQDFPSSLCVVASNELALANQSGAARWQRVDKALLLYLEAARLGHVSAYNALVHIYKSISTTDAQRKEVTAFLLSKEQGSKPLTQCALSTIALFIGNEDVAYEHARRALELSNNTLGYFELMKVYAYAPKKYMQGEQVFKVAEHTIQFLGLSDMVDIQNAFDIASYLSQLFFALIKYGDGSDIDDHAKELYSKLIAATEKAGIKIEKVTTVQEFTEKAANALVRIPGALQEDFEIPPCEFKLSAIAALLDTDFAQGLKMIDSAFEDMDSPLAQLFICDEDVFEKLLKASVNDNAYASFLLSKICSYNAVQATEDPQTCKKLLIEGLLVAGKAHELEKSNERYIAQHAAFIRQVLQVYMHRFIPRGGYDIASFKQIFAIIEPILNFDENVHTPHFTKEDRDSLYVQATECLYVLACNGYIKAAHTYADIFLQSKNPKEQEKALEALYRNSLALRKVDPKEAADMGIDELVGKHGAHIKELADNQRNASAAMVQSFWIIIEYRKQEAARAIDAQLKQLALDYADSYFLRAVKGGCKPAQFLSARKKIIGTEKLSKKEFEKLIKEIEMIALGEEEAAEFLMDLYVGDYGSVLPCGQKIAIDLTQAQKWATRIKDTNIQAWRVLACIATQQGKAEQSVLCKLEIVKRLLSFEGDELIELAQNCSVLNVYPQEVKDFLEARAYEGTIEAMHGLGAIHINRKEYEQGIEWLQKALDADRAGDCRFAPSIHFELAVVHVQHDWPGRNIDCIMGHVTQALDILGERAKDDKPVIKAMQAIGSCLVRLLEEATVKGNVDLKNRVITVLDNLVDIMILSEAIDIETLEHQLIMAVRHCINGSPYPIIFKHIEQAACYFGSKVRIEDIMQFKSTVAVIIWYLNKAKLEASKAENAKEVDSLNAKMAILVKQIPTMSMVASVPLNTIKQKVTKRKVIKKRR